ncbi:MAG: lysozyme inhibitor LprI family protein [Lachnospiraceae bacterium]|nr:lysozyme inhibitor LprI family protein [Lachnospiraceae bacterium]
MNNKLNNKGTYRSGLITKALIISLMAVIITGCGDSGNTDNTTDAETVSIQGSGQGINTGEESGNTDSSGDTQDATETGEQAPATQSASGADALVGNWVFVCSEYREDTAEEYGGDFTYGLMYDDEYAPDTKISVRKEGDKYIADYKYVSYPSEEFLIYGNELNYREKAPYQDSKQSWCMEFSDPFGDEPQTVRRLSIDDNGMLIESEEQFGSEDYSDFYAVNTRMYLKEDDPKLNDPENLAYFDTVTVSDPIELLNSIQSHRKVILKEGRYSLSGINMHDIDNPYITSDYYGYCISSVFGLSIEAEEGAEVLVCVDDPYNPVLNITSCGDVTLKGLTVGHDVEPGYCSGSVLNLNDVNGMNIKDCHLFGCGTYGIEAIYSSDLNVTDTEIYECTYGLVMLRDVGTTVFTNCLMRDSSDMSMIDVNGCYDVNFNSCEFNNNRSDFEYGDSYFAELDEFSHIYFTDCSFNGNVYKTFANREVTMENCEADGNKAAFLDMVPEVLSSPEAIQSAYEKACAKQQEIDDKVTNDELMDQLSLNQAAFEEYELWDSLLNKIWVYLGGALDEEKMEALRTEQKAWIKEKENAMQVAGADFEGGSMQPMIEYNTGAKSTRKRVELLIEQYVNANAQQ